MRSSFVWDFTQRRLVVGHRRFGTSYLSRFKGLYNSKRMVGSAANSVTNYRSTLRKIPEKRVSESHSLAVKPFTPLNDVFSFQQYISDFNKAQIRGHINVDAVNYGRFCCVELKMLSLNVLMVL